MLNFNNKVRILSKGKQQIKEVGFIEIAVNNIITTINNIPEYETFINSLIDNKILNNNNWWRESNFLYIG